MKFVNEAGSIHCIRVASGAIGDEREVIIATFHDEVESVPPHVAALLSPDEIVQLERWLLNQIELKKKLEQQPVEKTMLETLPVYLHECMHSLQSIEVIDAELSLSICESLDALKARLERISKSEEGHLECDALNETEVLKEQLISIKNSVTDK